MQTTQLEDLVPECLEPKIVSWKLKMPLDKLAHLRISGKGPPFLKMPGRKILYPIDSLLEWMKKRTATSTKASNALPGVDLTGTMAARQSPNTGRKPWKKAKARR